MKTGLRALLTLELDPVFFGMVCLLLASVLFSAKFMADEVLAAQDALFLSEHQGWYYLDSRGGFMVPIQMPISGSRRTNAWGV